MKLKTKIFLTGSLLFTIMGQVSANEFPKVRLSTVLERESKPKKPALDEMIAAVAVLPGTKIRFEQIPVSSILAGEKVILIPSEVKGATVVHDTKRMKAVTKFAVNHENEIDFTTEIDFQADSIPEILRTRLQLGKDDELKGQFKEVVHIVVRRDSKDSEPSFISFSKKIQGSAEDSSGTLYEWNYETFVTPDAMMKNWDIASLLSAIEVSGFVRKNGRDLDIPGILYGIFYNLFR